MAEPSARVDRHLFAVPRDSRPVMDLQYADEHVEILGCHPLSDLAQGDHLAVGVEAYVVATRNLVAERDPAGYWWVNQRVEDDVRRLVEAGVERTVPLSGPRGRAALAAQHPVLDRWWGDAAEPGRDGADFCYMPRWREHVPSARALWPLQNPDAPRLPFDHGALPSDDDWTVWSHVSDAVGIRSRAAVMAALLRTRFVGHDWASWVSLAGGALLPVMSSAVALSVAGVDVDVELWDSDPEAMMLAETLAEKHELLGHFAVRGANLYDLAALADVGPRYDMVDVLGFFEYLPTDLVPGLRVPTAGDFLSAALSLAKPGGTLVLGNMLSSRPQLDFVTRLVQWPYIRPRSLDELLDVIRRAGVHDDQITLYLPDDGVYAVATIDV
ncbi:hypothetical protein [Isoptericola haloaureus]|uniref:Class I SAM-dependent methyltransferase n=1 Tax=Isoptericola haloaureus TaxID=1542902 RepID=A0ABU7Z2S9_9MICO